MTIIAPMIEADLQAISVQSGQQDETDGLPLVTLLRGPAWTARDHAGRIIACGGFAPVYAGHFYAWVHLADDKRHGLIAITRHARAWLAQGRYRRVTTYARADWQEAQLWIAMLGFTCEGLLSAYGPLGEDYLVFGRVKGPGDVR